MWTYPWDVQDLGLETVSRDLHDRAGLNGINLATSYHAGRFLQPRSPKRKSYFPEDGTIYFNADSSRYGAVAPLVSRVTRERDVLRELTGDQRIATHVWLVLLHNTRLGQLHPDATVRNAFGDRYVYSLCPSSPDAREYAIALCRDVTDHYAVAGITLETPGFLPYVHGFHHEFAMLKPSRSLDARLGLCFCDHCIRGAASAGIDTHALQARTRDEIDTIIERADDLSDDMDDGFWTGDLVGDDLLTRYLRWRCDVVTTLVREIRAAVRREASVAVIPTVARPTGGAWYEGTDLHALAHEAGIIEAAFYEPTAARVRADVYDTRRRLRGAGTLRGILRPGYPDLQTRSEVVAAVTALREQGVSGIAFYNYGHLRRRNLAWIADAMQAWAG